MGVAFFKVGSILKKEAIWALDSIRSRVMVEQMDSGVETGNSSQQQQEVPASQTDPEPDSGLSLRRSHEALQEYLDGEQDIQSFLRTGESNDSGLGLEVEDLSNMGYRIPLGYPPETD